MQLKLLELNIVERDVASMENKIVVLDDSSQYCILNETTFKDKKYCCGVEYYEDKEDLGDDYIIFEEDLSGSSLVLIRVDNEELSDYILFKIADENDQKEENQ